MNKKLSLVLKLTAAVFAVAIIIALSAVLIPMATSLSEAETRDNFAAFIDSLGFLGIIVMLLLQILQIIVAIIPGEPIEILMGLMYGTVGGFILTLVGILIGQAVVFLLIKRFGIAFAKRFINIKKFEELSFIKNASKRDSLIFLLFFIPGTPKDVLTYFVGFTGIPFIRFMILSAVARIPSVITSTWAGATLSDGDFVKSAVIFTITGILGIVGIFINNKITTARNINQADLNQNKTQG